MQSGLLWYDGEPTRTLAAKVTAGAERFAERFGVTPDTCYVSDSALKEGEVSIPFQGGNLRLVPARNILANHFWLGLNEG